MRAFFLKHERKPFRRQVYVAYALYVALILGAAAFIAYQDLQFAERDTKIRVANLANSIDRTIEGKVAQVELTLNLLVDTLESQLIKADINNAATSRVIALALQRIPFASALRISDASGRPILGTGVDETKHVSWADRDYFMHGQTHNDRQVFISKPLMGRILNKQVVIFSMRYNQADGAFGGVVTIPIEVEVFREMLLGFDYQTKGLALIRYQDDLSFLTRSRLDPKDPQAQLGNTLVSNQLRDLNTSGVESALFHLKPALDGQERINAFHSVRNAPFFVVVSASGDDYLAGWKKSVAYLSGLCLVMALAGWVSAQGLIRKTSLGLLQERRLRALFELSAAGIVRTDIRGAFVEFNDAFAQMCGYSADELKQLDYWQLTPEKFKALEQQQLKAMDKTGRYGPYRKQYLRKDGTLIDVELSGVVVNEVNGKPFVWSLVSDITQELVSQQQLREAKEKADAANLSKSQFLATMSHELRTPLNGVLGMAQLLARPNVAEASRMDLARTIINSGNALASLLADLLDVSQIDTNKLMLRPEPCDACALTHDVAALFKPSIMAKSLDLQVQWHGPECQLYRLDPIRLRQMLSNLISNAVKFTDQGFVHVEGREVERTGTEAVLEFSVQDSGVGIPLEQQELLFRRFSQVENAAVPMSTGTGLGLSIIQGLAKRMGGTVGLDSESGQGARFWFRIQVVVLGQDAAEPASVASDTASAVAPAQGYDQAPEVPSMAAEEVFCLVVEDNPINQKVMTRFLSEMGIPAQCVGNGLEAVQAIEQGMRPKFILMDVQMPVMNGLIATQTIRAWENASFQARTVIIGLTAGAVEGDKDRCMDSGMDDVLFKPVDLDALEAKILDAIDTAADIDLDAATRVHIQYKLKLRKSIEQHETLDVHIVSRDDCCPLGLWIHGPGGRLFGHIPEFSDLKEKHVVFHQQAGLVAKVANQNDLDVAKLMLDSGTPYATATDAVCNAIVALQKKAVK